MSFFMGRIVKSLFCRNSCVDISFKRFCPFLLFLYAEIVLRVSASIAGFRRGASKRPDFSAYSRLSGSLHAHCDLWDEVEGQLVRVQGNLLQ